MTWFHTEKTERGDTIVEVLIVLAVMSLILTGAYQVTNRNIQASQQTQEQTQAQKLVEQQIEALRSVPDTTNTANMPEEGGCLDSSATPATGDACKVTIGGADYTLSIHNDSGTYKISATWDRLGGGTSDVTMYYRLGS